MGNSSSLNDTHTVIKIADGGVTRVVFTGHYLQCCSYIESAAHKDMARFQRRARTDIPYPLEYFIQSYGIIPLKALEELFPIVKIKE